MAKLVARTQIPPKGMYRYDPRPYEWRCDWCGMKTGGFATLGGARRDMEVHLSGRRHLVNSGERDDCQEALVPETGV